MDSSVWTKPTADAIQRRHALWYLLLAESADPEIANPKQSTWIARFEQEYANFRAAFDWCVVHSYPEPALRLAVALWWFWAVSGRATEGRDRLVRLLSRFAPRAAPRRYAIARARATQATANLVAFQGDYGSARTLHEEASRVFRELGDAASLEGALQALGWVASRQGDQQAAMAFLEEALALARARGDPVAIGIALFNLAYVAHDQGDFVAARQLLEESMVLKEEAGRCGAVGIIQLMLGLLAQDEGETSKARSLCEEGLRHCREAGDQRGVALALADFAVVATAQADYSAARAALEESISIQEQLGDPVGIAFVLERFAGLAAATNQPARAVCLAAAASGLRASIGVRLTKDGQARLDRWLVKARHALDKATADRAWEEGLALLPDQAIQMALERTLEFAEDRAPPVSRQPNALTRREREVAALIARGHTNHQIATELIVAEATAASHVVHILAKLGFGSRAQIAAWATAQAMVSASL